MIGKVRGLLPLTDFPLEPSLLLLNRCESDKTANWQPVYCQMRLLLQLLVPALET